MSSARPLLLVLLLAGCAGPAVSGMRPGANPSSPPPSSPSPSVQVAGASTPGDGGAAAPGGPVANAKSGQPAQPAASRSSASGPATQAPQLAPLRSTTLTTAILGKDWDVMADRGSSNDPHRYCGPVFPSDASLAGRVNVEYVRHTDGLRIEEEVSDYRAGQGQAAVDDYAAALRTCTHYTTGSGATSLTIEMAPTSWAKQRGNASTSGTVTFSNNQVTLYSRLVIFRTVNRVVVASISSTDQATLKQVAAGLAEQAWTTATSASPTAPQSR